MFNKKAQGLLLADIVSFALLILVLIIFFFLFSFAETKKTELISVGNNDQLTLPLLNYLRTSVGNMKISDLIILSEIDDKYKEELRENTENILSKVYGTCYRVTINGKDITGSYFIDAFESKIFLPFTEQIEVTFMLSPIYLNEETRSGCKIE